MAMSDYERQQIEEQAREDARTGNVTSDSALAAVHRGHGLSGHKNDAYQKTFKDEQQKRRERR